MLCSWQELSNGVTTVLTNTRLLKPRLIANGLEDLFVKHILLQCTYEMHSVSRAFGRHSPLLLRPRSVQGGCAVWCVVSSLCLTSISKIRSSTGTSYLSHFTASAAAVQTFGIGLT